ncbi:MAG TPA: ferritin-like domain-containing protein [Trebonia sp.]|jgi:LmbE family N-acetylglucosaminyl deacetylase|nr:ferritin-like domain-containing protein [Trebonia sp.]
MSANEPVSHLSEAELRAMTADLDAIHHDLTLPALKDSLAEWTEDIRAQGNAGRGNDGGDAEAGLFDRRRFLTRAAGTAGGVAGIALLAACSSSSSSSTSAPSSATASAKASATGSAAAAGGEGQMLSGDLQVVAMAASLENSGIATYAAGIKAASAGKLGTVPPAVVTFATTAMAQHKDHMQAWNAVLTAAGKQPVTAVDPVIQPTINTALAKVTTVTGLAELALMVENIAGETYQNGLTVIKSAAGIKTAASIQPVEFQHAAILSFVLGKYPVPNAFTGVSLARPPSDYKV